MTSKERPLRIMIALGGNAILRPSGKGTAEEQFASIRRTARSLARMIEEGDRIIVTHGNGPQVGDILLKNELAKDIVPPMPLDICGAESQGMIGYMLQQALDEELEERGLEIRAVTILTQVLVDRDDPAFVNPTKPIGPFYGKREASELTRERGWKMRREGARGYRRVVPSPEPRDIVEKETIRELFNSGALVIAAGGGGVPVAKNRRGTLKGIEAVLDKDRTAALLATILDVDTLLILTDVDHAYLDYDSPSRRPIIRSTAGTCRRYLREGQFASGSMGPKVESAVRFLESGGRRAIITSLELAERGLKGRAGTVITP